MFEKFGEAAKKVVEEARLECVRMDNLNVGSGHLLLALTKDQNSIATQTLAGMGVSFEKVQKETEQIDAGSAVGHKNIKLARDNSQEAEFSESALKAFALAADQCRYLGQEEVNPEHLLLAIVALDDAVAIKILEEFGVNMDFLYRHILRLIAQDCCFSQKSSSLRSALVRGIREFVLINQQATFALTELSKRSKVKLNFHPDRTKIVHMVLLAYLPEFLSTQVAFQRYFLEETINLLVQRTGPLDQELTATIVASSAQHLRLEVRSTIEYLWSHEYRLFDQMLDEAEHDLIGSVIEDLWWAQSEELALNDLFDAAMDDHRRKHVLSLQKRRIEIAHRITKLRSRLVETIQQCFVKRSASA